MKIIDIIFKYKFNILFFIIPILQFIMVEFFDGIYGVSSLLIPFNLIFYYGLMFLIIFITKNYHISIIITSTFWYLLGLINEIVYQFRGIPIFPSDILSIRTGISVVENYKFSVTKGFIISTVIFTLLIVISFFYRKTDYLKIKNKRILKRIIACLLVFIIIMGNTIFIFSDNFFSSLASIYADNVNSNKFDAHKFYDNNGTIVSFLKVGSDSVIKQPTDYNKEDYKELTDFKEDAEYKGPNIIVIMNEAFSDLSVLGNFETNKECLNFTKSDIVSKGELNVSIKGGNTANTELEFLTGVSMLTFPQGTVPYQAYIKNEMISLPAVLNKYNYDTYAFHPFKSNGWNRQSVYENFGFNHIYFEDDMKNKIQSGDVELKTFRGIVSDKTTYDCIINDYENRDSSKNFFEFCVTLQNHGGYEVVDDVPIGIKEKNAVENSEMNTYLSLINESDKAFENFVSYFEKQSEPTIILMFGDHQPADSVVEYLYSDESTLKNDVNRYIVPYFIWSNCNETLKLPSETSPNFLAAYLLEYLGIENNYFSTVKSYENIYPVITQNYIKDKNLNTILLNNSINDKLDDYIKLCYYNTFDYKNNF